jgi:hypothetical protein
LIQFDILLEKIIIKIIVCRQFCSQDMPAEREMHASGVLVRRKSGCESRRGVQYVDVLMPPGNISFVRNHLAALVMRRANPVVAADPDVTVFAIGDVVTWGHAPAAFAQLADAKGVLCDKAPAGLTMARVGVFRGVYTTACRVAATRTPGDRRGGVPVHGPAGGIGIAAIDAHTGGLDEAGPGRCANPVLSSPNRRRLSHQRHKDGCARGFPTPRGSARRRKRFSWSSIAGDRQIRAAELRLGQPEFPT